jgi:hypothetical protein
VYFGAFRGKPVFWHSFNMTLGWDRILTLSVENGIEKLEKVMNKKAE